MLKHKVNEITHLSLPAAFAGVVPESSDALEVPAWICHLKLGTKPKCIQSHIQQSNIAQANQVSPTSCDHEMVVLTAAFRLCSHSR